VFGCSPGLGIKSDSKYTLDIAKLFNNNAHAIYNSIILPKVFNQVKPTDCMLEIATSNLAQQLRIYRTNDVVGHKLLLYAFDSAKNKAMSGTRKLL